MDRKDFEKLVAAGIDDIPEPFASKLNNVVVVVEGEPTAEQLSRGRVGRGGTLFGLYEGIPQTKRGSGYTLVLPDKITIFQKPIEVVAGGRTETIKQIVKDTVWHEIAHHFGLGEGEVRRREQDRKGKKPPTFDEHEID